MIKTIYFDFFKVISSPPLTFVMQKYLPESEQKVFTEKLIPLDLGDLSEKEYIRQFAKVASISEEALSEEIRNAPQIDLQLVEYIRKLKTRFRIGLLSNAARNIIERIMGEHMDIFDIIIISSDCKFLKPHKEIYELAIEKAGCKPEEILFTDDTEANIEGAKALGINTILYTNFENFQKDIRVYVD